ncbi:uncharacterized protein LOC130452920 [Diorhabda sublineata]|uniref:uncharacterized protein LOC130452920 n=1 Tax=Diorhabda sublineata TaxID=1163346 RepID=UPI0024E0BB3F|nr:uncharacterized protein LOC130452920 [Diorhabda sublineata]
MVKTSHAKCFIIFLFLEFSLNAGFKTKKEEPLIFQIGEKLLKHEGILEVLKPVFKVILKNLFESGEDDLLKLFDKDKEPPLIELAEKLFDHEGLSEVLKPILKILLKTLIEKGEDAVLDLFDKDSKDDPLSSLVGEYPSLKKLFKELSKVIENENENVQISVPVVVEKHYPPNWRDYYYTILEDRGRNVECLIPGDCYETCFWC